MSLVSVKLLLSFLWLLHEAKEYNIVVWWRPIYIKEIITATLIRIQRVVFVFMKVVSPVLLKTNGHIEIDIVYQGQVCPFMISFSENTAFVMALHSSEERCTSISRKMQN